MKIDVRNWIKGLEGVRNIHVADRRIAQELKASHMRSGRVSPRASEEAATAHVLAYGFDELGNIVALCSDGHVRQFMANARRAFSL